MITGIYFDAETRSFSCDRQFSENVFDDKGNFIGIKDASGKFHAAGADADFGKKYTHSGKGGGYMGDPKAGTSKPVKVKVDAKAKEAWKNAKATKKSAEFKAALASKKADLQKSDAVRKFYQGQGKAQAYKNAGIAAGATLAAGGAALAAHKIIQKRKEKKAAAEAK